MALLGRAIFHDAALSGDGRRACATCHQPENAYAPADSTAASLIAPRRTGAVMRAVPSLRYASRIPVFGIGPDARDDDEPVRARPPDTLAAHGGLFWDGRANTLQGQAMGPLFNPDEMANTDAASVGGKLRRAPYAERFAALFGAGIFADPVRLVDEAMFAVARYEIEDPSFHPYDSKYDLYLEGRATLTRDEWRGLQVFEDPRRGNCAACHLDRPTADGRPPAFTDYEYVALGVPSGRVASPVVDLGACGPLRGDLAESARMCGTFRTPSLRNTATRVVYFHNGVYRTLEQVLAFYAFRDTRPESVYAHEKFAGLPRTYRGNVDTTDGPLNRKRGAAPAMTADEMRDVIAFLETLNDGWVGRLLACRTCSGHQLSQRKQLGQDRGLDRRLAIRRELR
jgi:cytochrome c peroxidase